METNPTIGEYLISRLQDNGVRHVFGIPGDYVLGFYDLLERSPLETITTCDEQGAGFAADGYARMHGLGAVCVTYCVGGLKLVNPVAGAFAEKSPIVVISGAPGIHEREHDPLLHHKVRNFETQQKVFEQITAASAVLDDPLTAFSEIDRVIAAAHRHSRPVYLELPRDMTGVRGTSTSRPTFSQEPSAPPEVFEEALGETLSMLNAASRPVILADVELHRFNLQNAALQLIEKSGIPFASTLMGKSVLSEAHPLYLGLYEGAMGGEEARAAVEASDCVLILGAFMTDINLGIYTARLDPAHTISISSQRLSIRNHVFESVGFKTFLQALANAAGQTLHSREPHFVHPAPIPDFELEAQASLTVARLFHRLNEFLNEETTVVCDIGDALFGAADLPIRPPSAFLGPAYYASMGFGIPAAIGVELFDRTRRPLVIVGDGSFQMTGLELSTAVRNHLNPIVLILDNGGYGTERNLQDGAYNDILPWHYTELPKLLGVGRAWDVHTEGDFDRALEEATANTGSFSLLDLHIGKHDRSPALARLASRLSQRLAGTGSTTAEPVAETPVLAAH